MAFSHLSISYIDKMCIYGKLDEQPMHEGNQNGYYQRNPLSYHSDNFEIVLSFCLQCLENKHFSCCFSVFGK